MNFLQVHVEHKVLLAQAKENTFKILINSIICDFWFCCPVKRRRNKTSLALCTWTVAQELTDLFDKTAALKNKEDFCCLYMEIYCLVMEITEVKESDDGK